MCGGQRSFRLCGGLPRGSALLGDRRPFLQRCLAAVHTRAKGIRAGRQNLTFVAVPQEKKEHISSTTDSINLFAITDTSVELAIHSVSLSFYPHLMSLNIDMRIIRPWNCSGSPILLMNWENIPLEFHWFSVDCDQSSVL